MKPSVPTLKELEDRLRVTEIIRARHLASGTPYIKALDVDIWALRVAINHLEQSRARPA